MDGVPVAIEYQAPAACPADAEFWKAFASRATHAVRSEHGYWTLDARVEPARGGFSGTLRILRGAETTLVRSLVDESCADLVTALAIVGAITVESTHPAPLPDAPIDVPPPRIEPGRVSLRTGLDSEATSFLSPSASLGLAAFVDVEQPTGILTLRARVGVHYAANLPVHVGSGVQSASALVTGVFGRFELGGLRLRFARVLALRLAALADVGALVVEGRGSTNAQTATAPFFDVGAIARLAWETPVFFVEAGVGGVVLVYRARFLFPLDDQPGSVVAFDVPVAGAIGEVGVGVRFF